MNLNTPSIDPGPLTAADLDAARKHSTGRVYHLHRATVAQCPPCHGMCQQGRDCNADDDCCAPEGGSYREPADAMESMWRYRAAVSAIRHGLALAFVLAVAGYVARVVWPI